MSLEIEQKEAELPCDDKVAHKLLEILQELIIIPSPSGHEEKIANYIIEKFRNNEKWVVKKDEKDPKWNVYISPKNMDETQCLGLLNAHLDTYHDNTFGQNRLQKGTIFKFEKQRLDSSYYVNKTFPDIFYGFDDKIGVAIIIYLMQCTDLKFHAILSTEEEKTDDEELRIDYMKNKENKKRGGGGGIESALIYCPEFFTKTSWAITLDRANKTNIITEYGGISLCSTDFLNKIKEISKVVGFPMEMDPTGVIGDAYNIRKHNSSLDVVNLSVGILKTEPQHDIQKEKLNISYAVGTLKVVEKCLKSEGFLH